MGGAAGPYGAMVFFSSTDFDEISIFGSGTIFNFSHISTNIICFLILSYYGSKLSIKSEKSLLK
jgi:hypothetical protein